MDGTGELLTGLIERLSLHRPVRVISYPTNISLGYDDLTTFVANRAPKDRFAILGESFSGPIAIEIAATEPRVAGLILASSFAWHPIPSLFIPLAHTLDTKWMPTRIIEAALLAQLKHHFS
jgi:pimeloyl-[acyl-carrier protein] methyl ester esterase